MIPKFVLGRNFCTPHLIAKFHRPTFNCSDVIVLTNKHADAAENVHLAPLCYAGGYNKWSSALSWERCSHG